MPLFKIYIRDINDLRPIEVTAMYSRLSNPGYNMQEELATRYLTPTIGPQEAMNIAMIWHNDTFAAWVGTRRFVERYKGKLVNVQTIECFTDPEYRNRGFCAIGVQALIAAQLLDRNRPVSVYRANVVKIAERCGCRCVILCESEKSPKQPALRHLPGLGWVHQLDPGECAFDAL
jgi:hypothetical protein